jgi:PhzF family phenazine biosynthesis protein
MKYRLYQVDSFTKEKFCGNPAGVVTNADGLTELEMQKIAREMNNSETAFIFSAQNSDHDVWVRFFTPSCEVPICGHATIAAHYVRAVELGLESSKLIQKTGAGNLPVEIIKEKSDYKIVMTQGQISFHDIEQKYQQEIILALGLEERDLDAKCPIEIVSTGHSKVMIGIKSKKLLNALKPDLVVLSGLSKKIGCGGYYVFTFDSDDAEILIHGRMFAPAIGIAEDPVTGNASGCLGVYLVQHNLVQNDGAEFFFKCQQGEIIGRKGVVGVRVFVDAGKPRLVQVEGGAVIVFKTEILV